MLVLIDLLNPDHKFIGTSLQLGSIAHPAAGYAIIGRIWFVVIKPVYSVVCVLVWLVNIYLAWFSPAVVAISMCELQELLVC